MVTMLAVSAIGGNGGCLQRRQAGGSAWLLAVASVAQLPRAGVVPFLSEPSLSRKAEPQGRSSGAFREGLGERKRCPRPFLLVGALSGLADQGSWHGRLRRLR